MTLRGFTIIELLVALVIAAILAAVAVPSYRVYVMRSQRTDATAALLRIQAAQEVFFLRHHRYASGLTAAPPEGLGLTGRSQQGLYVLGLEVDDPDQASAFTALATPRPSSGQVDDLRCQRFTLDQGGRRGAWDASGADRTAECWR